jgi:NADPH:quinone reductase-like Zn-dependent oxidoreductase
VKAIVQDRYGPPDVLELRDIEAPEPGDDQVLIRVAAAGLDAGVWHLTAGLPYFVRIMGFGFRAPKTRVRADVAGRVEAVGRNVTKFKVGDEVYGTCAGGFAEFAVASQDAVMAKPANLTFEQAAVVPISAGTAIQALRDRGNVQPGQKVLIIGAGGGVGTFAVQLAKTFGAEVTGVCSTTKTDLVRSIGADDVVDYTREDFADRLERYDLIIDTAGNRSVRHLRRALAPKGRLVIVGGEQGGRVFAGIGRNLRAYVMSLFVSQNLGALMAKDRVEDLELLKELIEAGKVAPIIDRTFALNEVPKAIAYWLEGHVAGKVVITVRS